MLADVLKLVVTLVVTVVVVFAAITWIQGAIV